MKNVENNVWQWLWMLVAIGSSGSLFWESAFGGFVHFSIAFCSLLLISALNFFFLFLCAYSPFWFWHTHKYSKTFVMKNYIEGICYKLNFYGGYTWVILTFMFFFPCLKLISILNKSSDWCPSTFSLFICVKI